MACADIHMLDGNRLQEFLTQAGLQERPIYGRVLTALQNRLKDAEQLGSLLRLDEEIRALVEQERQRYEQEGRQLELPRLVTSNSLKQKPADVNSGKSWRFRLARLSMRSHGSAPLLARTTHSSRAKPQKDCNSWKSCLGGTTWS